jgi:hypothetical protein
MARETFGAFLIKIGAKAVRLSTLADAFSINFYIYPDNPDNTGKYKKTQTFLPSGCPDRTQVNPVRTPTPMNGSTGLAHSRVQVPIDTTRPAARRWRRPTAACPANITPKKPGCPWDQLNVDVDPRDCDRFHLGHLERDGAGRVGSI